MLGFVASTGSIASGSLGAREPEPLCYAFAGTWKSCNIIDEPCDQLRPCRTAATDRSPSAVGALSSNPACQIVAR